MWKTIAYGAKGLCFFSYYVMNQGYESGGYGLVGLNGIATDRATQAGRMASIITNYTSLFSSCQVKRAMMAIVYNPLLYTAGGNTLDSATNIW